MEKTKGIRVAALAAALVAVMLLMVPQLVRGSIPQAEAATASSVKVMPVTKQAGKYSVKATQKAIDSTTLSVSLKQAKALKKAKVSKVKVTATLFYGKKALVVKSTTKTLKSLSKTGNRITCKLPVYGSYRVSVKYYGAKGKPKKLVKTVTLKNVGIAASQYSIAVLNGTMAPLAFAMSCFDDRNILKNNNGKTIPTYVTVSRPKSIDWKSLPSGMKSCPFASGPAKGSYGQRVTAMKAYVGNLHKANKNSKFNLYIADNGLGNVYRVMYANGVDDDILKVHMLTDGSGTAYWYNSVYNVDDPWSVNRSMVSELARLQSRAATGKSIDYRTMKYVTYNGKGSLALSKYTYAAYCGHDNYDWLITYDGGFKISDPTFLARTKKAYEKVTLASDLDAIKAKGNSEKLKAFFKMDGQMFAGAEKAGKKPLVIMGTRVSSEENFEPFAKFLKKYYGNAYQYYYKGHPATPTSEYPEKAAQLKKLGIADIDSSIPAELLVFYYPEMYVAGLSNSTLNSSYQAGHTLAYLNVRLSNQSKITNGNLFQIFFTKIDSGYEDAIKSLVKDDSSLEHSYLAELNDGTGTIAIFNDKTDNITTYSYDKNSKQYSKVS